MKNFLKKISPLTAAFLLSFVYWFYLLLTTQTQVVWDSLDYQALGKMLAEQGWMEFFKTGPHREPLYPFFISLAMRLAEIWGISYLKILDAMQLLCLFLTQLLSFKILQKLKINPLITALTILYIGFSPALVNMALSVYSEIIIFPIVLATILLCTHSFSQLKNNSTLKILLSGFFVGILLILLVFVKGIFELINPFFILSSLLLLPALSPNKKLLRRYAFLVGIILITFYTALFSYKSVNKHYNGIYTLTTRGPWALYGFAARRAETLSTEQWLTNLAFIPGEGSCYSLFSKEKCFFWTPHYSDTLGMTLMEELTHAGYSGEALDKKLIQLSIEKVMSRPFQYSVLLGLESLKIFFWESTKMAFVAYPKWLEKIFDLTLFKNILRLLVAILSFCSFIFLLGALTRNDRRKDFIPETYLLLFFAASLIIFYTGAYSIFLLNTRYALPMAPLFIILIAWLASAKLNAKSN